MARLPLTDRYDEAHSITETLRALEDTRYRMHCSHQGAIRETMRVLAARLLLNLQDGTPETSSKNVEHVLAAARGISSLHQPQDCPASTLLEACKLALHTLEDLTTDAFEKGGDKPARDALEYAIETAEIKAQRAHTA